MNPQVIPVGYQVFYIVIPTINIIGNSFNVYVTIRAKCFIFHESTPTKGSSPIWSRSNVIRVQVAHSDGVQK
ncbi:hypothetical protein KIN20_032438 [Parelaphostrongylus tenuis]|uniref:Uncharacterized protein n=1 Tax=Parelaphostrongylus tenuis TaxID=148309 RepID=A0AAD5WHQ3_PARTN|nr:hypothetical protein KIN20_032438 [Parelaphostrongylus tenuis]